MTSRLSLFLLPFLFLLSCGTAGGPCHAELRHLKTGKVHTVAGQLEAYNNRNVALFSSFFHPDVELYRLGESEPYLKGIQGLRETYRKMFRESPKLHCKVVRRMKLGDFVVDEEIVTGIRQSGPVHAIAIYELRDNRIFRVWFIRGR